MHAACLRCSTCSAALSGSPFRAHGGRPFCPPCFAEAHAPRCTRCALAIEGASLNCGASVFHPGCARCARCDAPVGGRGLPFRASPDGNLDCATCVNSGADQRGAGGAVSHGRPVRPQSRPVSDVESLVSSAGASATKVSSHGAAARSAPHKSGVRGPGIAHRKAAAHNEISVIYASLDT